MLYRTIWDELEKWKERKHHPLIISGMRQIGKTYIVKEFGEKKYKSVIYIDLRLNKTFHSVFDGDFNVDMMVMSITSKDVHARFVANDTLLILDEIQDCPNARSSLKYWDIDGRYDVIATGSFLGVKGFRGPYIRGIPVGYEEEIQMLPLTFKEFLVNVGITDEIFEYVSKSLKEERCIAQPIHESLYSLYLQYLIVGGMPEAVNDFLDTHDLNRVRETQRRILKSMRDDFGRCKDSKGNDKVNETLKLRAESCLDSIPAQLAKEYKKFQYSLVETRDRSAEKSEGLQYLADTGLILKSYNVREMVSPLEGAKIFNEFKAFYADTGLLISQLNDDTAAKILEGDLSAYKGAIAENAVAIALNALNMGLYYYRGTSGSPELDFIVDLHGEVTIIECKSSNNRATSMKYVLANPKKYGQHKAIKIANANVGNASGYKTVPLYALAFIENKNASNIVETIDVSKLKVPSEK